MTTQTESSNLHIWLIAFGTLIALTILGAATGGVGGFGVGLILGMLILVVVTFVMGVIANRILKDAFWELSNQLGLDLARFHLFTIGVGPKLTPIKRGKMDGTLFTAFQYSYAIQDRKYLKDVFQTVIWLQDGSARVPEFKIEPEAHWINTDLSALLFGNADIDFESHPEFSRLFLLRGHDAAEIRELFNDEVLEFFERHPGRSVEAASNKLIYYRKGVVIESDEVKELIKEAHQLLSLFQA